MYSNIKHQQQNIKGDRNKYDIGARWVSYSGR